MGVPVPVDTHREAHPASGSALRLEVLGPLRVWRDGVELDPGPPQQAYLLAVLLARAGRPTSAAELVDLIWGEGAPASALNVIHKYIGALRRLLEPAVPLRESGSHLLRRGTGYLFTAGPSILDLERFRSLIVAARSTLTQHRRDSALASFTEALGLWTGPAGDGLALGPAAAPVFAALNDEFYDACVAAADLAVSLKEPERVLAQVQLAAVMAPLHEPVQAALVHLLGAAGRQGEALSLFRSVRARLANDLGIDPGHALHTAHQRVLAQTSTRAVPPVETERPWQVGGLVGREEELAVLRQAMAPVFTGDSALIIVEGEPGAGKTRLLEEVGAEADRRGALVVWGRCLQGNGTPSMWPWVQVVNSVVANLPTPVQENWLATDIGRLVEPRDGILAGSVLLDGGGQFRLFDSVAAILGEVAAQQPLVLVIDDLHWADVASLQLFAHLAARLPGGTVVVGSLRDRAPAPGTELARVLAAASRMPGHRRLRLGPLNRDEVAELVRRETGQNPDPSAIRSIHTRTAGNPFFVRELSRFLADGGELTIDATGHEGVPSTVRDVVRDRLADIDDEVLGLLQIAALIGREVPLRLLAEVADGDVQTCLERLEPLAGLGVLAPAPADPYSFRFTHDLVRESVAEITPSGRATQLHLRIADALQHTYSDDESVVERLAYHLWSAGPLADSARTASALVRAGSRAATKSALEAAEHHFRVAVEISRKAGLGEVELSALSQLTAVVGMRSMYGTASVELLERAEHLARGLGRKLDATGFLFSRWTAHQQGIELSRSGPLARQLLEQGYASADLMMRTYGLQAWGLHQWDIGNVGESFRYLSQTQPTLLQGLARSEEDPVRGDLQLLMTGMLAEVTALHGDVDAAQALLAMLEAVAEDNPYRITVWATMASRIAALVGDTGTALRAAERGIAADPGFSYVFLGTYQRLARCWAQVVTGESAAAAISDAQRLIAANLLDPPRSCVATWYALLGEMHLTVGAMDDAAAALDRAQFYLDAYGQRYPEGLLLLLRARLLHARGASAPEVRAAAATARRLSLDREARLFVDRVDEFLTQLG